MVVMRVYRRRFINRKILESLPAPGNTLPGNVGLATQFMSVNMKGGGGGEEGV